MNEFINLHDLSQLQLDNPISSSPSPRPRLQPRNLQVINNTRRLIPMENNIVSEELNHLQPPQILNEPEIQGQSSSGELLINDINDEQLNTAAETETHPIPIIISGTENIQLHNEENAHELVDSPIATIPIPTIMSTSDFANSHPSKTGGNPRRKITAINQSTLKEELNDVDPGVIHHVKAYNRSQKAMKIGRDKKRKYEYIIHYTEHKKKYKLTLFTCVKND